MKIALNINAQFPVSHYGGTERVVAWLAQALVEKGHQVHVFCRSNTIAAKDLNYPVSAVDFFDSKFSRILEKFDVVHFHSPIPPHLLFSTPTLVTTHGNGRPGEIFHPNTIFVSQNHAQRHNWSHFVYNGLNPEEYPLQLPTQERNLLFLAKASWRVKNLRGAIRIANRCRHRLIIAGGRATWYQSLFANVESLGFVNHSLKLKAIRRSRALLFPVLWHEPFGLAVIESLVCGRPVLATPYGSLPELVTPECGILSANENELIKACANLDCFDGEACRQRVLKNFTHHHMADAYEKYYKIISTQKNIDRGRPYISAIQNNKKLLKLER